MEKYNMNGSVDAITCEEWRPIRGFEGLYEVSNLGRVRSLDGWRDWTTRCGNPGKRFYRGRIIIPQLKNSGYLFIMLHDHDTYRIATIHRLVAETFVPNPDNFNVVNHKDENKLNNAASNLEWCTYSYNVNYGTTIKRNRAGHKSKPVEQLTLDGTVIARFEGIHEAARMTGLRRCEIGRCIKKSTSTTRGYRWRLSQ